MTVTAGYCTLADVVAQSNIGSGDNTRASTVVPRAIAAAEAWIDRYCGRGFKSFPAAVREFAPDRPGTRYLETGDISAVTGLRFRSDRRADWTPVPEGDFTLAPVGDGNVFHPGTPAPGVMLYADAGVFPWRPAPETTVEVTGDFGWGAVPGPVKQACIVIAVRLAVQFSQLGDGEGIGGEDVDGMAWSGAVAEVRRMLDQGGYRLGWVA